MLADVGDDGVGTDDADDRATVGGEKLGVTAEDEFRGLVEVGVDGREVLEVAHEGRAFLVRISNLVSRSVAPSSSVFQLIVILNLAMFSTTGAHVTEDNFSLTAVRLHVR